MTAIEDSAFEGCTNLQEIEIPSTVYEIGNGAFSECNNLKKVELPKNNGRFTYLDTNTFYNCSSLEEIELPSSLVRIGSWAFCGCTSLEHIKIPDRVKDGCISAYAFKNCPNLKSIEWHGKIYTDSDEFNEKFAPEKTGIWTK